MPISETFRSDLHRPCRGRNNQCPGGHKCPETVQELGFWWPPTPYYISNDSYAGGYSKKKLDEMLRLIDNDYMGWAVSIAPRLAGEQEKTELSKEIANTLCHTDPEIALHFARTTMLSDYRKHLKKLKLSTLIIQPEDDMLVDMEVGDYIQQNIPYSEMVILKSKGHYPQLSNPKEIISALRIFL